MGLIDITSILPSLFSNDELKSLNSSGIDIPNFFRDYKSLTDNGINPLKLLDNLSKLRSLGADVTSVLDLEKVKDVDVNQIVSKSIDLKLIQNGLNKLQNTGINITSFDQSFSKVKAAGLNMEKINDIPKLLSSNLLSQGQNLLGNLQGQSGNLLGNAQAQAANLLGNTQAGNLLGNIGNNVKTSLDSNLAAKSQNLSDASKPQNTQVVQTPRTKAIQILVPSQYIDVYVLSKWSGAPALMTHPDSQQLVWYDKEFDKPEFIPSNLTYPAQTNDKGTKDFGINIHLGYPGGKKVGDWSEDGSHCFASEEDLNEFFGLCEKHVNMNGNKFSYTLVTKEDWEQAFRNVEANKVAPPVQETVINSNPQSASQSQVNAQNTQTQTANKEGLPKISTENNEVAPRIAQDPTVSGATASNSKKPSFFETTLDIIAFQIWANKNKLKTTLLGVWDASTQKAWDSISTKSLPGSSYVRSLKGITNTELKLVHARLNPYGSGINIGGNLVYKASFSPKKISLAIDDTFPYSVIFNIKGEFKIVDNFTKITICNGVYSNGGRKLVIEDGANKGKTLENEVAWDNILACFS